MSDYALARLAIEAARKRGRPARRAARPVDALRAKVAGRRFTPAELTAITGDIVAGRYSKVELTALVVSGAIHGPDDDEVVALVEAMVASGSGCRAAAPVVADKHSIGGVPGIAPRCIVVAIAVAAGLTVPVDPGEGACRGLDACGARHPGGRGRRPATPGGEELRGRFERLAARLGLRLRAFVTDGAAPIGRGVGPAPEMRDVLSVLRCEPEAPPDLGAKAVALAGWLLELVGAAAPGAGEPAAAFLLASGAAPAKFQSMREAQGARDLGPPGWQTHELADAGRVAAIRNDVLAHVVGDGDRAAATAHACREGPASSSLP